MVTIPKNNAEQRLIYKTVGEREIELLFYPPHKAVYDRAPVLFLIPGGGWSMSVAESMYGMARPLAETLRENGFAAAAVSYRNHRDDGVMMPAIADDVFDAASYLAQHAATLGIDPHRMVTCGHSAGGHLSLMLAYAPCDFGAQRVYNAPFTVCGSVPISPPVSMGATPQELERYRFSRGLGHLFQGCEGELARYSPLWWAQNGHGVPTMTAAGDRDSLVSAVNSEDLCEALQAHGIRGEVLISHGGGHCLEPIECEAVSLSLAEVLAQMADFVLEENGR